MLARFAVGSQTSGSVRLVRAGRQTAQKPAASPQTSQRSRVRLVAIGPDGAVDLQPCGGTHVRSTGEIGAVAVTKIEKKGRQNRRIRLAFVDRA